MYTLMYTIYINSFLSNLFYTYCSICSKKTSSLSTVHVRSKSTVHVRNISKPNYHSPCNLMELHISLDIIVISSRILSSIRCISYPS